MVLFCKYNIDKKCVTKLHKWKLYQYLRSYNCYTFTPHRFDWEDDNNDLNEEELSLILYKELGEKYDEPPAFPNRGFGFTHNANSTNSMQFNLHSAAEMPDITFKYTSIQTGTKVSVTVTGKENLVGQAD